jgi:hypothetical protein
LQRSAVRGLVGAAVLFGVSVAFIRSAQACDFAGVKSAIDNVLDAGKDKSIEFRKEFRDGADPFTILDGMVDEAMRAKIDVCRFQVAEYLTKRGFPPSH